MAVHHFSSTHDGKLPTIDGAPNSANRGISFFSALLPYIERGQAYRAIQDDPPMLGVRTYVSPADPTNPDNYLPVSSYAANAQVFIDLPTMARTFGDGTSSTIILAEHYSHLCQRIQFNYLVRVGADGGVGGFIRRATFADGGPILEYQNYGDTFPVTSGNPPTSIGDRAEFFGPWTFQAAPPRNKCIPMIPQTPHASGMIVALGDGSVRILAPSMSPNTFWGAVTPRGEEVLGNDW